MFNNFLKKVWPHILILVVISAFFIRLFIPPSIFVNPDFGRSDLIHFNIPIRYFMSESLKDFKLPLWNQDIGQGFPVFDEGQFGLFYPPNFILFFLFPFWMAFNLGYFATFIICAYGVYFLSKSFGVNRAGSATASLIFTFSPIMILHLHHYNLIQSVSLFPWVLLATNRLYEKRTIHSVALMAFVVGLQVLTGFIQIAVYSTFAAFLFLLTKIFKDKLMQKVQFLFLFFCSIVLAAGISFVQIASSYRLSVEAKRSSLLDTQKILTEFPFKPINLLSVVNPFILGNPKFGTYPQYQRGEWGIFWENTVYVGLVPLILSLAIQFNYLKIKNKKTKNLILIFSLFEILGILLSLGNLAPLHPLFSFPPFSYFRVPARFLMFTFLAAALLTGLYLQKASESKNPKTKILIPVILISLIVMDIFKTWYSFPLVGKKNDWLKSPQLASNVKDDQRIFSYGMEAKWDELFLKTGWSENNEFYNFLRNFLSENSNLEFGVSQSKAYGGMIPYRQAIVSLATEEFIKKNGVLLQIGEPSQQLLNANGIQYLTTSNPIDSDKWQLIDHVNRKSDQIFLYKNSEVKPRAYLASQYQVANTNQQFRDIITSSNADISKNIILEQEIDFHTSSNKNLGSVSITKSENQIVSLDANLEEDSLVVLSDSYYPGWKAYIDGKETKIYPANVNSRAVITSKGQHTILFKYQPKNFGGQLSLSLIFTIGTLVVLSRPKKNH